ncbi:MAG: aminotransferase class I/II-fold pyridoxal phosphate-dependent enzyme [Balneolaceae bacterium]
MPDKKKFNFETIAIHGETREDSKEGGEPVIYPRVDSTTFRMSEKEDVTPVYTRHENPNRSQLESILAVMEQGEAAAAFSSGMAASTAILQALEPGAHVLIPNDLYHGVRKLAVEIMASWNLEVTSADMTRIGEIEKALQPNTKMVWAETPSNPLLEITDIEKTAELCNRRNLLLVVDNTWPSPVNMQPLSLGADLVMHSTSKYIGGHSDLLGGAVIAKTGKGIFEKIRDLQQSTGSVPSPGDCWMMLRSIRTLPWRMRGHNENAGIVAEYLANHKFVSKVFYPGLPDHPGHGTAKKQMNGFGGMLSFLVKGNREETGRVFLSSELIYPATSLGGVESLWEHRIRSEGPGSTTPDNLIRLSVGLEHPEDIIADIDQALKAVFSSH